MPESRIPKMQVVNSDEAVIQSVAGTVSASGDNLLIAAVPNLLIVLCSALVENDSSNPTVVMLRQGTTPFARRRCQNQGDGVLWVFQPGREYKLPVNTALNLNLSGANAVGYTIFYYLEAP